MTALTFDTGMLISLERHRKRALEVFRRAVETKARMCAPSPVITEWWRGRSDVRESLLAAIYVDPISEAVARLAGEAISLVRGATAIDAIVMASAAVRGSLVYTSDVEDLTRLQRFFPGVRVLGV